MNKNALIIFVRNAELGKVKTRLAKTLGDEKTLEVYQQLLLHTISVTKDLNVDKFVFYNKEINKNDIWENNIYKKELQTGNDLGEKMKNAITHLLNLGYEKCVIIGSDLFDLDVTHINKSFEKLNINDFVIGPAQDGGYYLLGLKKVVSTIFENKEWSTESVLTDTLRDLQNHSVFQLEILNDIDTEEDLLKSAYYRKNYIENGI